MKFLITIIDAAGKREPYLAVGNAQALQDDAYDNQGALGLTMLVLP